MRHYRIQLIDSVSGKAIDAAGGVAYIAVNGAANKVAVKDVLGAVAANPVALNYGILEFWTLDSVAKVDLYIQGPTGHFLVAKNVAPSGPNSLYIDKSRCTSTMVIPFSIADTTATTETATGFTVPLLGGVLPAGTGIDVLVLDAGITIETGTLSSAAGDADGHVDGISVAAAVGVKATLTNGAVTLGALLKVQDSANAGDAVPEPDFASSGKSITYTLSAGADTAAGFIKLPVQLNQAAL